MRINRHALLCTIAIVQSCTAYESNNSPHQADVKELISFQERMGISQEPSKWEIKIHGKAWDHGSTEAITIASRLKNGDWIIDEASEIRPDMPVDAVPQINKTPQKRITGSAAKRLFDLTSDPEIYNAPIQGGTIDRGIFQFTMTITSPHGNRTVTWAARLNGKLGEVADLVIGPG